METQDLILTSCALNCNSHLMKDKNTGEEKRVGNQTECSLLDFVNRSLQNMGKVEGQDNIDAYNQIKKSHKLLKMIPFNSDTKKMTVVVELEAEKMVRVYTKGASENLIDDCTTMVEKNNKHTDLDLSMRDKIKEDILKKMAQDALRTIAIGYKDISYSEYRKWVPEDDQQLNNDKETTTKGEESKQEESKENQEAADFTSKQSKQGGGDSHGTDFEGDVKSKKSHESNLDTDLTLIAIFGIQDPLRKEIQSAIQKCQ